MDGLGERLPVRRITIQLDEPTEDGDKEIHLLTNSPNRVKARRASGAVWASVECGRGVQRVSHGAHAARSAASAIRRRRSLPSLSGWWRTTF